MSFVFARTAGISLQRVKQRGRTRKVSLPLDSAAPCGNTAKGKAMTAAFDTLSSARLRQAARGPVSILLVAILPL